MARSHYTRELEGRSREKRKRERDQGVDSEGRDQRKMEKVKGRRWRRRARTRRKKLPLSLAPPLLPISLLHSQPLHFGLSRDAFYLRHLVFSRTIDRETMESSSSLISYRITPFTSGSFIYRSFIKWCISAQKDGVRSKSDKRARRHTVMHKFIVISCR